MSNNENAGGKARAIIEKEEARNRIDEYNKNPNICKFCKKPIIAPYNKKLCDIKRKVFCSRSCATKFNNLKNIRNKTGKNGTTPLILTKTDEEIISAFNNSDSITEFGRKLGYRSKIGKTKIISEKLKSLGLNINDIDGTHTKQISNLTKEELFNRYSSWQTARSSIQKDARNIYENSNRPKQCICCGYNKHYEVAHIKAVSEFNDDTLISEINDTKNLIALCPNHHWEYDNTDFDITPYLEEVN
jgi:hypothetical protein